MITTELKLITFSQEYLKLININHEEPITLLEVFVKDTKDLHPIFVIYDTVYKDRSETDQFYKLGKGEHLVLLFSDKYGNLFTTIRSRWNKQGDKLDYYLNARGKDFKVIFKIQD